MYCNYIIYSDYVIYVLFFKTTIQTLVKPSSDALTSRGQDGAHSLLIKIHIYLGCGFSFHLYSDTLLFAYLEQGWGSIFLPRAIQIFMIAYAGH